MSTITYNETEEQIEAKMHAMEEHLAQWQAALDQLVKELTNVKSNSQEKYEGEISYWQERLHQMQVRLQAMAEGDDRKEWVEGWPELLERLAEFREGFLELANNMKDEAENANLAWLDSFIYERNRETTNWIEQ